MAQLLMPKATAVWLVNNTTLTFEQIAAFCDLHSLEVQGIADGEVAIGIVGLDPTLNGQLTKEEAEHIQKVFRRIRDDLQNIFDPKGLSKPTRSPCQPQH